MIPLAVESAALILAVAALVSAVSGCIVNAWTIRTSRREERDKAEELCRERLKNARADAEKMAEELYQIRIARGHREA